MTNEKTILDYIAVSNEMQHRFAKQSEDLLGQKQAAAAIIPDLVDQMLTVGAIQPSQKIAAAEHLRDLPRALAVLKNALDALAETHKKTASDLGAPAGASAPAASSPIFGSRNSRDVRAADLALASAYGIPVNQE